MFPMGILVFDIADRFRHQAFSDRRLVNLDAI
jgi:hypothetical protein